MDAEQIRNIAIACVVSAGGIGAIVIAVIKFAFNFIADRLSLKYENKLEKILERHKTELSKKEYISKTRFDTEFRMYQELSGKNLSITLYKNLFKTFYFLSITINLRFCLMDPWLTKKET